MTLSIELLRRLLKDRGTLSAYDGAKALMCQPEQFCALAATDWWNTEQIAGPSGFLYRLRPTVSTTRRPVREVTEYADSVQIGRTGFGRQSREVTK